MIKTTHVVDLLPAYAMNTISDEEVSLVENHLATCLACQQELHQYQAVVQVLPFATPEKEPPGHLKMRLMSQVSAQRLGKQQAVGISGWQKLTNFLQQKAPLWAMTSALLVVVLAISNLMLWQKVSTIGEKQMQVVALQGTQQNPQASGMLIISMDGKHGTLVVDNLPIPETTKQFQLWLIKDGERTNGGVFSVEEGGYASLYIDSPQALSSYTAFGVTLEPAGGSPQPTGVKVLGGEL